MTRDRHGSIITTAKETLRTQRELLKVKDRLLELEREVRSQQEEDEEEK